ncbi:type IV toxin-antitoxin system AbiEi family antitoxin domain-containing protein [Promicromonospora sukumoe]|uniref:type IV toxin-antitoxin system AbiEi family antitoxin domain-containing protein n=1 Tax=Promicromonospora sukumoe TaxID=88382 RepID=UPI0003A81095|nr:type IV toxin-antitoxin system AbiEi family antitoxin domain-containing protein [Promicromonospora sukumoe]
MSRRQAVPEELLVLARRQGGLVSAEQCDAVGVGPSRRRSFVTGGAWRRVIRGVYDTGDVPVGLHPHDAARQRAAWTALLTNRRAIAVGACALVLHGVQGLPRRITPEYALPRGAAGRPRDGIVLRQYVTRAETVRIRGREVAGVECALVQALPTLSRDEAVATLDSALHQGLIDVTQLASIRRRLRRRRDAFKVIPWLALTDGRAESPPESHARLRLHDAEIAPDDLQRDFFDATGRFLGRADMAWHLGAGRWLIVEIDSQEFHGTDRQAERDAVRQNGLLSEGRNIVLRFFPTHLSTNDIVTQVADILRRSTWRPPAHPSSKVLTTAVAATDGPRVAATAVVNVGGAGWSEPGHTRAGNTMWFTND